MTSLQPSDKTVSARRRQLSTHAATTKKKSATAARNTDGLLSMTKLNVRLIKQNKHNGRNDRLNEPSSTSNNPYADPTVQYAEPDTATMKA